MSIQNLFSDVKMEEDRRILVNEVDEDVDELELEFQGTEKESRAGEETCLNIVYLSSIVASIGT